MGTFNTLSIETECGKCHLTFTQRLQFRFGEVWQYDYVRGDKIKRGDPNNDVGRPMIAKVRVWGTSENNICPYCGYQNPEDYDIIIEEDVITGISSFTNPDKYPEANDHNYFVDE